MTYVCRDKLKFSISSLLSDKCGHPKTFWKIVSIWFGWFSSFWKENWIYSNSVLRHCPDAYWRYQLIESTEMPKSTEISLTSAKRSCPDAILSPSAWGNLDEILELCHEQMELPTWWKREPMAEVIVPGGTASIIHIWFFLTISPSFLGCTKLRLSPPWRTKLVCEN